MGKHKPSKLRDQQKQHHSTAKVVLNEPAHALKLADDKNVVLCAAEDLREFLTRRAVQTRNEICDALGIRKDLSDLRHMAFVNVPGEWGLEAVTL